MDLTVVAIKREDCLYHFNHPHQDTLEELLCNGTEKVIDTYFYFLTGRAAVPGNEIEIYLTTEEPENVDDYDTSLKFMCADSEGSTYYYEVTCEEVWFCPWLQGYFENIPDNLYIKLNVINKGLNAFVKNTGMTGFLNKR